MDDEDEDCSVANSLVGIVRDKEYIKQYKKIYYAKNKDKYKENRLNNIEHIKEYKKEYRLKNLERIREYKKIYYAKNKDKYKQNRLKNENI